MTAKVFPTPEENRARFQGNGVCVFPVWKNKKPYLPINVKIGECTLGQSVFWVFVGIDFTFKEIDLEKRDDIINAWIALAGNGYLAVPFEIMKDAVKQAVQLEWYRLMGRTPSQRVIDYHHEFLEIAKLAVDDTSNTISRGPKKGTMKVKDVIIAGLLAGHDTKEIVQAVHDQFSDAHTGPKDIAFYRCKLRKEGLLPKFVGKSKSPTK